MNLKSNGSLFMLMLAFVSIVALPAHGEGADSSVKRPGAMAIDEHRYIIDADGKQVRLVGTRFYSNPKNKMRFPGRETLSQSRDVK